MTNRHLLLIFLLLSTLSRGQIPADKFKIDTTDRPAIEVYVTLIDNLKKMKIPKKCNGRKFPSEVSLSYKVDKLVNGEYHSDIICIRAGCLREMVKYKIIENNKVYHYKLRPFKKRTPDDVETQIDFVIFKEYD